MEVGWLKSVVQLGAYNRVSSSTRPKIYRNIGIFPQKNIGEYSLSLKIQEICRSKINKYQHIGKESTEWYLSYASQVCTRYKLQGFYSNFIYIWKAYRIRQVKLQIRCPPPPPPPWPHSHSIKPSTLYNWLYVKKRYAQSYYDICIYIYIYIIFIKISAEVERLLFRLVNRAQP